MKRKTETDALLHQLVATLSNYHDTLTKHVISPGDAVPANEFHPDDEETFVWITVKDASRAYGKWVVGLELFALLAAVDWKVWTQQVKQIWPDSRWDEWCSKPTRVGVDLGISVQGRFEPAYAWLGMSSESQTQSQELIEARLLVHKILQQRGEVVTHVPVRLRYYPRDKLTTSLFHAMQLVLTQQHFSQLGDGFKTNIREDSAAVVYDGLRVQYITLLTASNRLENAVGLQYLAVIVDAGVAVHRVGLLRTDMETQSPLRLLQSLWKLFAIGETEADVCRRCAQEATVALSYSPSLLKGMLSAYKASGSLCAAGVVHDEISSREKRQAAWKWIAYALFSSLSTHQQLQKISLHPGDFDDDDLQQIKSVLSAADPIAVLLGRNPTLAMVTVTAARFRLIDPTKKKSKDTATIVCDNTLHDLHVLKRAKLWTQVLLPGWGEAWVHRDDIMDTQQGELGPFEIQSIPEVTLTGLLGMTRPAVLDFVRLVGLGIRKLALHGSPYYRDTSAFKFSDWSDAIFDACPRLVSLHLKEVEITSLRFVVDGYTSGKCRLESFKVTNNGLVIVADDSLSQLVDALADKRHPAARYLREFVLFPLEGKPTIEDAAVAMLTHNKRLRVFDIRYYPNYNDDDDDEGDGSEEESNTHGFRAFDGEFISQAQSRLDIRQRLAFLSVIRPRDGDRVTRSTTRDRAVEMLDANVVSLVFEMAAQCMKRRVYVGGAFPEQRRLRSIFD